MSTDEIVSNITVNFLKKMTSSYLMVLLLVQNMQKNWKMAECRFVKKTQLSKLNKHILCKY